MGLQWNASYFSMRLRQTGTSSVILTEFLSQDRQKYLDYVDDCFLQQVWIFERIILIQFAPASLKSFLKACSNICNFFPLNSEKGPGHVSDPQVTYRFQKEIWQFDVIA